jgi:AcrR family transcriptional regulator
MSRGDREVTGGPEGDLDDLWPPFGPVPPRQGSIPRHHRGRRQAHPLTRAEIVRAAIVVADAEGAGAVNMRRIARELDAGAMSLYWHVADKDHLLDLMVDGVEGEQEVGQATGDWKDDLARLARQQRQGLLRHPWVVDFLGGRPRLGPRIILHLEQSLALVDDLDLDTRTSLDVLMTLNTYVLGAVIRELQEIRSEQDLQAIPDRKAIDAGILQWQASLRASGRFTRFLRIFDEDIDPDSPETREERFEFGLGCVLDGIASQIERRRS